jgi:hypothetical protein
MHQPRIHGIYQLLYQRGIRPVLLITDCAEIVFPVSVKSPDTFVIPKSSIRKYSDNFRYAVRTH